MKKGVLPIYRMTPSVFLIGIAFFGDTRISGCIEDFVWVSTDAYNMDMLDHYSLD
jgi:hypothetical protein